MYHNGGLGIKGQIDFLAGSILKQDSLLYCPCCIKEDVDVRGETYSRVIWQVQGYKVCHVHNVILEAYPVQQKEVGRVAYIYLDQSRVIDRIPQKNQSGNLFAISNMISENLEGKLSSFDAKKLKELYLRRLRERDYLTVNGEVNYRKLLPDFVDYYGTFLEYMESGIDPFFYHSWFRKIVRSKHVKVHPVRHMLYIQFLFGSIEGLLIDAKRKNISKRYPCLNKICPEYRRFVINDVKITADFKSREPVGTFECPVCGYIYSRKLKEENQFQIGRVKCFGPLFMKELQCLKLREDMSLREKARYLGCDPGTVKKYEDRYDS